MTEPAPEAAAGAVEETALLGGRVRLLQPRQGYRAAMDPVLLAAAVPLHGPGPVRRVLDAGLGPGAAALCLLARAGPGLVVTGVEIEAGAAALARRAAALNGWAARLTVVEGDLAAPPPALATADPFDVVLTNPPYLEAGTPPPDRGRAGAHVAAVPLADWLVACLARLRPKGRLVVIHRADRLDALLAALAGRAGAAEVIPLWPGPGADGVPRPARRVIVRARKGLRGGAVLSPGLVLHGPGGGHTAAAEDVLRGAAALGAVLARPDGAGGARGEQR